MKTLNASGSSAKTGLAGILTCLLTVGLVTGAEPVLPLDLGGGVGIDLVLVPAGDFAQGSPAEESGSGPDETRRQVTISREFYMGRTAVTRRQWERFVAETGYRSEAETGSSGGYGWDDSALVQKKQFIWRNPGFPQTSDHPVCLVTFPDAQAFCKWVERKTKRKTTLPTEAQWEYSCRAGTTTPWHSGASADEAAWHKGNSGNATHPVDSKPANAWGLFIGGNVSEWCLDWYAPYQERPVTDPRQDNPNLSEKPRRVLRGGSWNRGPNNTRSAARYRADPRSRNADIGFRIVCATKVIPPQPKSEPRFPRVEVEPGVTPPVSKPIPHREMPAKHITRHRGVGSIVGSLFGSMLCLLIPIGFIILLVRFIVGQGRKKNANPFVVPPSSQKPPARRQQVRMADDGFWIQGDWPAGTPLSVRYARNDVASTLDLIYQPGPGGQFVFTGRAPDSASVVAESAAPSPPPLSAGPPPLRAQPETRRPVGPPPPIFPSAY